MSADIQPMDEQETRAYKDFHARQKDDYCTGCSVLWPCPTARLIATVEIMTQQRDAAREHMRIRHGCSMDFGVDPDYDAEPIPEQLRINRQEPKPEPVRCNCGHTRIAAKGCPCECHPLPEPKPETCKKLRIVLVETFGGDSQLEHEACGNPLPCPEHSKTCKVMVKDDLTSHGWTEAPCGNPLPCEEHLRCSAPCDADGSECGRVACAEPGHEEGRR